MEQISRRVSRHLPFVYSLLGNSAPHKKIFLSGKIGEKEADIYRSPNFLLREEYIKNISANP